MFHLIFTVFVAVLGVLNAQTTILTNSSLPQDVHQIAGNVFSCDSSNSLVQAICQAALTKLNAELKSAGILIDSNGVLFTYDDPKNVKINTGHSCTNTAKIKHRHIKVRFTRGARLDVTMKSLIEPFLIRVELPVRIHSRIDIKQRRGFRVFGRCANTASDSFSFKADSSTTANIVIGFTLDPKLGVISTGDYALVIKPRFSVVFDLDNFKLNFKVSGVSLFSRWFSSIFGLSSSLLKTVTALIEGKGVSDIVKKAAIFDVGVPILLGIGILPAPLERVIWKKLLYKKAVSKLNKRAVRLATELEDILNGKLRNKFKLNKKGERVIIIKKDIVNLLASGKGPNDVLIYAPDDPSISCHSEFTRERICRDILCSRMGCPGCSRGHGACLRMHNRWKKRYAPENVVPSKPKISKS